ncbi:MAG TPA: general stress protein [Gemmatimonadales bacterium]|nr:general stress protein [Gemmatimonadales bacterium]
MTRKQRHDATAAQDTTGRTVVGLFARRQDADAAIRDLKAAGFRDDQVGVALQNREEQGDLLEPEPTRAKEAEGAAAGAVSGGLVGGLIGLLGSLLVPGVGPIVVGGVLASTLTGAGIGAATGGIIGALMGLGVPETDARHFDQGLRLGSTLVTVDAGPRTSEALVILDRHGMDFGPSGTERFAAFDHAAGTAGDPTMAGLDIGSTGIGMGDVASGSSTGSRGFESRRPAARERRMRQDPAYGGPERRVEAGR